MAYLFELDDLRPSISGDGGTVYVVPKLDGSPISPTGLSSLSWSVRLDGGSVASGSTSPTSVSFGDETVARFAVAIPSLDLRENYVLSGAWTQGAITSSEVVVFDVVLYPLGGLVSSNDIVRMHPDASVDVVRYAEALGVSGTDAEKLAAGSRNLASLARQEVERHLVNKAEADGSPRLYQVLDRRAISQVEAAFALSHLFLSTARNPDDGDDDSSARHRYWRTRAASLLSEMRVLYHSPESESGTPEDTTAWGGYTPIRKVQSLPNHSGVNENVSPLGRRSE